MGVMKRLLNTPTSPRPHSAIKREDYGLKVVFLLIGESQKVFMATVFALHAGKIFPLTTPDVRSIIESTIIPPVAQ